MTSTQEDDAACLFPRLGLSFAFPPPFSSTLHPPADQPAFPDLSDPVAPPTPVDVIPAVRSARAEPQPGGSGGRREWRSAVARRGSRRTGHRGSLLVPAVRPLRRSRPGLGLPIPAAPGPQRLRVTQTAHHVVRGRASATPASRERAFQARSLGRLQRERQQQQRRPRGHRGPGGSLGGRRRPRGLGDGGESVARGGGAAGKEEPASCARFSGRSPLPPHSALGLWARREAFPFWAGALHIS